MNSSEPFSTTHPYPLTGPGRICDKLLGSALLLCTMFGIPGNFYSFKYFKSTRKRDLGTLLYKTICCVDV